MKKYKQCFKNNFVCPKRSKGYIFQTLFALMYLCIGCSPLGDRIDEKSPNYFYNSSKNDVHYSPSGDWFMEGNKALHANIESFEVLGEMIARDKNQVYFRNYTIDTKAMDLKSFYVIPYSNLNNIGFDKDNVYAFVSEFDSISNSKRNFAKRVEGANPEMFTQIDWDWSKDDKNYFFNYNRMNVEYATFKNLSYRFVKDSSKVLGRFDNGFRPIAADPSSFIPLNYENYGRDSKNVYWFTNQYSEPSEMHIIPFSDPSDITIFNNVYLGIVDKLYFKGKLMEGVDARTFKNLNTHYSADSTAIIFRVDTIPKSN